VVEDCSSTNATGTGRNTMGQKTWVPAENFPRSHGKTHQPTAASTDFSFF